MGALHEFMKQRRINERCLELFPGLVKMEFWLFKHPEFLKESYMPPSIFNVEPWELNATKQLEAAIDNPEDHTYLRDANDQYDKMVMFELNSKEDFFAFCNKTRELKLPCRAMYEDPNYDGPEYPEDHNYDYDYDHAQQ